MAETLDFARLAGPIPNAYVEEWKAAGGRVAGFFCAHAPEELLWAAGMLPVRMRGTGNEDTSSADPYLGPSNCSFVRHTLSRVLGGEYGFLDGLLVTNSCDHIRRLFDVFRAKESAPFCHYVDVPHLSGEASLARLMRQLEDLKQRLESAFAVTITPARLAEAIKLHNRTRALLCRAAELRAEDPPRLSGSELLAMGVAAASMPKDRFNPLLERRLGQLADRGAGGATGRPRLLILGGELDDPGLLGLIESMGADVVADQLCWGAKCFSCQADESLEPMEAIARRMLEHLPCPRMLGDYSKRLASVLEAADRYRIDGIICQRLKFCDLWGGEVEMLRRSLREERRLPLLVLERDYLPGSGIGQLRTRVHAFVETLG